MKTRTLSSGFSRSISSSLSSFASESKATLTALFLARRALLASGSLAVLIMNLWKSMGVLIQMRFFSR
ncbi:MAG: hypothetical protein JRM95_05015 [Nitrososphaerota archaeon]|nr:hypothetical protein [Nitrososphaerota archaeon]